MKIVVLNDKFYEGATNLPLLEIRFLNKKIDILNYDTIIFTSKNGVEAINRITNLWKNLNIYSIGRATTKKVESFGLKVTYTAKNSYGDIFAKEIAEELKDKRVIYIRPERVVSNFSEILRERGVNIDEVILYKTLCKRYSKDKRPKKNSTIIFSSPSTIECFFKSFSWDKSYQAVVIGKKTAKYMPKNISYIISSQQDINYCIKLAKTRDLTIN